MTTVEIILIAIGLAMDAFAVSISVATTEYLSSKRARFRISFHFGLFQALMPVIGWFAGNSINLYIKTFDHWIAFFLLGWVGTKMIRESRAKEEQSYRLDPSRGWNLVVLAVATSIDALAVGLSLALIGAGIWQAAVLIGIITAGLSFAGILLGVRIGAGLGKKAAFAGGVLLCGIGIRILVEHLFC
ncbi:manganese efflux pump [candidate division KSB1 bacterium]|nr:MAG: manganese efflux pump [candidate division KSB1 bacterium]